MNNIKNTWNGIKSIITTKNLSSDIPKSLSSNGSTISNQVEISNVFDSIPIKILMLLKNDISSQLADIYSTSHSRQVFFQLY